jgi:hypothetical protein
LLAGKADVRFNGPITLPDSEPEPDIAIVRLPESAYNDRHPGRDDIFWVLEVAKTSLKKDLDLKTLSTHLLKFKSIGYWIYLLGE